MHPALLVGYHWHRVQGTSQTTHIVHPVTGLFRSTICSRPGLSASCHRRKLCP